MISNDLVELDVVDLFLHESKQLLYRHLIEGSLMGLTGGLESHFEDLVMVPFGPPESGKDSGGG